MKVLSSNAFPKTPVPLPVLYSTDHSSLARTEFRGYFGRALLKGNLFKSLARALSILNGAPEAGAAFTREQVRVRWIRNPGAVHRLAGCPWTRWKVMV